MSGTDWMGSAVASVLTATFVAAICAGYVKILKARQSVARENRLDQVSVLANTIEDLKSDRDGFKHSLSELRSEHTACLLEQERLRASNKWLHKHVAGLEDRIKQLEEQMVKLSDASPHSPR